MAEPEIGLMYGELSLEELTHHDVTLLYHSLLDLCQNAPSLHLSQQRRAEIKALTDKVGRAYFRGFSRETRIWEDHKVPLDFIIVQYQNRLYRPAGYRVPFKSELYVSKDGKVKRCQIDRTGAGQEAAQGPRFDGSRLILREVTVVDVPSQGTPEYFDNAKYHASVTKP